MLFRSPEDECSHALATDEISRQIVSGGVLYPCQAIFLRGALPLLPRGSSALSEAPFVIVENDGVLFNQNASTAQRATLASLAQVTLRTEALAPVRYLSHAEVAEILNKNVHSYTAEAALRTKKKKSEMLTPAARRNSLLQLRSRPA